MIKNDKWIIEQAEKGMIVPFEKSLIRQLENRKVISFGLSSYGYDLSLSELDFRVFRHIPGTIVDPKRFNPKNLETAVLQEDEDGSKYFVIPANAYGLGVSREKVSMPKNVTAICVGKSTLARCGIIANITPIEAGWEGYITLEFSNASSADCRIYANEGVVQLLFFEGDPCATSYADRNGKYQNQQAMVTLAKI
ncbi:MULTISPECIES: dCTP deaminase [Nostocales]|uniref:Deoxycytidine triphosphate deaminase n=3 Tax=Nostocales TaxID=1161 RepID=A0A0C1R7W8_9CYAN|nr:dCTP deaminase [Tolypothrix bouteillei]KAF3883708.1 dCTP deaminase [Tolypothrix bouteillei VB521301]